jgi:hypothetical protein
MVDVLALGIVLFLPWSGPSSNPTFLAESSFSWSSLAHILTVTDCQFVSCERDTVYIYPYLHTVNIRVEQQVIMGFLILYTFRLVIVLDLVS